MLATDPRSVLPDTDRLGRRDAHDRRGHEGVGLPRIERHGAHHRPIVDGHHGARRVGYDPDVLAERVADGGPREDELAAPAARRHDLVGPFLTARAGHPTGIGAAAAAGVHDDGRRGRDERAVGLAPALATSEVARHVGLPRRERDLEAQPGDPVAPERRRGSWRSSKRDRGVRRCIDGDEVEAALRVISGEDRVEWIPGHAEPRAQREVLLLDGGGHLPGAVEKSMDDGDLAAGFHEDASRLGGGEMGDRGLRGREHTSERAAHRDGEGLRRSAVDPVESRDRLRRARRDDQVVRIRCDRVERARPRVRAVGARRRLSRGNVVAVSPHGTALSLGRQGETDRHDGSD